jgi:hypothetical protein
MERGHEKRDDTIRLLRNERKERLVVIKMYWGGGVTREGVHLKKNLVASRLS